MKWFKNMIIQWVRDDWENAKESVKYISDTPKLLSSRDTDSLSEADPVLNFRVFSAVGGKIVEFRRYDRQRDRHEVQTYIITNDQNFGERIAKIATMENIKS
jgi:hypothetical protein